MRPFRQSRTLPTKLRFRGTGRVRCARLEILRRRLCPWRVRRTNRWTDFVELAALFLLHGMAMGMWFVPLSTVLDAHGLHGIKPYAFAASALAAFVTPL